MHGIDGPNLSDGDKPRKPGKRGVRGDCRRGAGCYGIRGPLVKGTKMLYALDIESTGLSPIESKMVSVAIAAPDESLVLVSEDEVSLFRDLTAWLKNSRRKPGTIVTWNGAGFDWPYMYTRAMALGVGEFLDELTIVEHEERRPTYKPIEGHNGGYAVSFAGHDHADIMRPWKSWSVSQKISNSLKSVAKAKGIDVIEVDRTKITELSRAELVAYNISDVAATLTLAEQLGPDIEHWKDSRLIG